MTYQMLFYGGFLLFFLTFICSIVLCIKFHILYIIGILSGLTAKREVNRVQKSRNRNSPVKKKVPANNRSFHIIHEFTFMDTSSIIK